MEGRISIGEIIARNNPQGAAEFVQKYGYKPSASMGNTAFAINRILLIRGDGALKELMEYHPDREIIMEREGHADFTGNRRADNEFHNCCGGGTHHNASGCKCGGSHHHNADGGAASSHQMHAADLFGQRAFYAILGISAIFALVILAKQDKQRA